MNSIQKHHDHVIHLSNFSSIFTCDMKCQCQFIPVNYSREFIPDCWYKYTAWGNVGETWLTDLLDNYKDFDIFVTID